MKKKSIKQRITLWYTLVLVIVLSIFLGGAFVASEQYSKTEMKEELIDEIGDLEEDISNILIIFRAMISWHIMMMVLCLGFIIQKET